MSEIEKMYENAGILKECLSPCYINKTWRKTHDCPNCDNRENYPSFTAEKQIKLIKWLSDFTDFGTFSIDHDKSEYGIAFCVHDDGYYFVDKIFEECIAKSIKYLWQSLTEEEKQQVKGFLE